MAHAIVLTEFGGPEVLRWQVVPEPSPGPGEVLFQVRAAGVGPTDLHIRSGALSGVFPQRPGDVLGFEAAGTVVAIGDGVAGIAVGDDISALLPAQGGYAELATTSTWVPKPASVSWEQAAALPASAEVSVGVLREVRVAPGETLVVLGAAGSVGQILVQLAVAQGTRVIGIAAERDADLVRALGGEAIGYGEGVFDRVARATARVDAVIDAAGRGGIAEAIEATGDAARVITLVDPSALGFGARMTVPGPERAPDALEITMPLLERGELRLKSRRTIPLPEAGEAHRLLESGAVHEKVVLVAS